MTEYEKGLGRVKNAMFSPLHVIFTANTIAFSANTKAHYAEKNHAVHYMSVEETCQ